ncbi:MAG: multicopper oxidase family protein [Comamonadaceae bacterium]|nr:MAG: multicopper oxidase family protein [Comamonadaceae bacterium]
MKIAVIKQGDPSQIPQVIDQSRRQLVFAGIATAGLAGCGGGLTDSPMSLNSAAVPEPAALAAMTPAVGAWRTLPLLQNTASAGHFTATLTAAPALANFVQGVGTRIFAYNGGTPGPVIEAYEGDQVRITLNNNLGQDTTVHWHGLAIPADQDGNPMEPVAAGTSRDYVYSLPLGSAGSYWYHPHPHGSTPEQVYRGLAGAFIVRSRTDPLAMLPERKAFITDLRLDSSGQIAPNTALDLANGREGNQVLVNGAYQPVDTVAPGTTERWRVFNASNGRYTRLVLDGAPMVLVALDGSALAKPLTVSELLLAPGQRGELVVRAPPSSGQKLVLRTLTYNRGVMVPVSPAVKLFEISTSNEAVHAAVALPASLPAPLPLPNNLAMTQTLVLSDMGMGMGMMGGSATGRFTINGKVFDPARDDISMKAGVAEEWIVHNSGMMDHPLHIHGTAFQLVASSRANSASDPRLNAFMDVVNLTPGEQIRIRLRIATPGRRMFHCHILEHEAQGMMGVINVSA